MNRYRHHRHSAGFWGTIFIVVGSLFLLETIGLFDIGEFIGTFWPVALIAVGTWILLKSKRMNRETEEPHLRMYTGDHEDAVRSDTIDMSHLFGDVNVSIRSRNFQGGHISTVFGDMTVDLSDIDMSTGEWELTLHTVFGDIRIIPPARAAYSLQGSAVVGDIKTAGDRQSGFFPRLEHASGEFEQAPNRLRIYASHVFGDIKI